MPWWRDRRALTDLDLLALLSRDGMGGHGGISKAEYYALSDREIVHSYFAPFDKKGRLVCLRKRSWADDGGGGVTGDPDRAGRELPSAESLAVPPECLLCGCPMAYVLLWWSVWRSRKKLDGSEFTTAELLDRWWAERAETPPKGYDGGR